MGQYLRTYKNRIVILLTLLALGCGEKVGQLRQSGENASEDPAAKGNSARGCSGSQVKTKTITVSFQDPRVEFSNPSFTCDWGKNGNTSPVAERASGRLEQTASAELLDSTTSSISEICSASISTASGYQTMYRDQWVLSLNDVVLFSTMTGPLNQLAKSGSYFLYDWFHLAGGPVFDYFPILGIIFNPYCLDDGNNGPTSCNLPDGNFSSSRPFSMKFASSTLMPILKRNTDSIHTHLFRLATIGDIDTGDCSHNGLDFSLTVNFVE